MQSQPKIDAEYVALTHELFSKTISGHLYRGFTVLNENEAPKQEFEVNIRFNDKFLKTQR